MCACTQDLHAEARRAAETAKRRTPPPILAIPPRAPPPASRPPSARVTSTDNLASPPPPPQSQPPAAVTADTMYPAPTPAPAPATPGPPPLPSTPASALQHTPKRHWTPAGPWVGPLDDPAYTGPRWCDEERAEEERRSREAAEARAEREATRGACEGAALSPQRRRVAAIAAAAAADAKATPKRTEPSTSAGVGAGAGMGEASGPGAATPQAGRPPPHSPGTARTHTHTPRRDAASGTSVAARARPASAPSRTNKPAPDGAKSAPLCAPSTPEAAATPSARCSAPAAPAPRPPLPGPFVAAAAAHKPGRELGIAHLRAEGGDDADVLLATPRSGSAGAGGGPGAEEVSSSCAPLDPPEVSHSPLVAGRPGTAAGTAVVRAFPPLPQTVPSLADSSSAVPVDPAIMRRLSASDTSSAAGGVDNRDGLREDVGAGSLMCPSARAATSPHESAHRVSQGAGGATKDGGGAACAEPTDASLAILNAKSELADVGELAPGRGGSEEERACMGSGTHAPAEPRQAWEDGEQPDRQATGAPASRPGDTIIAAAMQTRQTWGSGPGDGDGPEGTVAPDEWWAQPSKVVPVKKWGLSAGAECGPAKTITGEKATTAGASNNDMGPNSAHLHRPAVAGRRRVVRHHVRAATPPSPSPSPPSLGLKGRFSPSPAAVLAIGDPSFLSLQQRGIPFASPPAQRHLLAATAAGSASRATSPPHLRRVTFAGVPPSPVKRSAKSTAATTAADEHRASPRKARRHAAGSDKLRTPSHTRRQVTNKAPARAGATRGAVEGRRKRRSPPTVGSPSRPKRHHASSSSPRRRHVPRAKSPPTLQATDDVHHDEAGSFRGGTGGESDVDEGDDGGSLNERSAGKASPSPSASLALPPDERTAPALISVSGACAADNAPPDMPRQPGVGAPLRVVRLGPVAVDKRPELAMPPAATAPPPLSPIRGSLAPPSPSHATHHPMSPRVPLMATASTWQPPRAPPSPRPLTTNGAGGAASPRALLAAAAAAAAAPGAPLPPPSPRSRTRYALECLPGAQQLAALAVLGSPRAAPQQPPPSPPLAASAAAATDASQAPVIAVHQGGSLLAAARASADSASAGNHAEQQSQVKASARAPPRSLSVPLSVLAAHRDVLLRMMADRAARTRVSEQPGPTSAAVLAPAPAEHTPPQLPPSLSPPLPPSLAPPADGNTAPAISSSCSAAPTPPPAASTVPNDIPGTSASTSVISPALAAPSPAIPAVAGDHASPAAAPQATSLTLTPIASAPPFQPAPPSPPLLFGAALTPASTVPPALPPPPGGFVETAPRGPLAVGVGAPSIAARIQAARQATATAATAATPSAPPLALPAAPGPLARLRAVLTQREHQHAAMVAELAGSTEATSPPVSLPGALEATALPPRLAEAALGSPSPPTLPAAGAAAAVPLPSLPAQSPDIISATRTPPLAAPDPLSLGNFLGARLLAALAAPTPPMPPASPPRSDLVSPGTDALATPPLPVRNEAMQREAAGSVDESAPAATSAVGLSRLPGEPTRAAPVTQAEAPPVPVDKDVETHRSSPSSPAGHVSPRAREDPARPRRPRPRRHPATDSPSFSPSASSASGLRPTACSAELAAASVSSALSSMSTSSFSASCSSPSFSSFSSTSPSSPASASSPSVSPLPVSSPPRTGPPGLVAECPIHGRAVRGRVKVAFAAPAEGAAGATTVAAPTTTSVASVPLTVASAGTLASAPLAASRAMLDEV